MMNASDDESGRGEARRIVITCDTTPMGRAALEAGAALAAAFGYEILGLFVEDTELVRMAALPFTREFGLQSAVPRPVDPPDIERAFRLQAQQTRDAVGLAAAARKLRWEFRVARGKVVRTTLEVAREADMIVFGKQVHAAAVRDAWRTLGGRQDRPTVVGIRIVAVLFDGSASAWRALESAHALCGITGSCLTLLVPATGADGFERLRQQVRAWLADQGRVARIVRLESREAAVVARAVRDVDAAALLWPAGAAVENSGLLDALLAALGCPLVVIS